MNKLFVALAAAIAGSSVMFSGPALADDADIRTVVHVVRDRSELIPPFEFNLKYDAVADIEGSVTGTYACPAGGAVIATFADVDREGRLKGKVKLVGVLGEVYNKERVIIPKGGTSVIIVPCPLSFDVDDPEIKQRRFVRFVGKFKESDDYDGYDD